MDPNQTPENLAAQHGTASIGESQRQIPFTVVASGGTGLINITAAAHGLKKHQCFAIIGGAYADIHRIKKVIDANTIQVEATFGATAAGTLLLLAYKEGFGFWVNTAPVVIEDIDPENKYLDVAVIKARPYAAGQYVPLAFKKIRISAGDITIIRQPLRSTLSYTNR